MQIINPATGNLIKEIDNASATNVRAAYEKLRAGQRKWAQVPIKERIACIAKFVQLLEQNTERIAEQLTQEMGKPLAEARGEVGGAVFRTGYFIRECEQVLSSQKVADAGGTIEYLNYRPLGVVGNISAWNYPLLIGVNVHIPALIAGNSVLYKPSEFTTLTGLLLTELYHQAGIPEDVFICTTGERETGQAVLDCPLNGFFFTGSYRTGKFIAEQVASKLVPVGLELGGKDPLYVTDDIKSVDTAAAIACEGSFYNNGQSCCAVERVYVHEKVYDDFVASFQKNVEKLVVGDPTNEQTTNGPLARAAQVEFLQKQLDQAIAQGAEVLATAGRVSTQSGYFNPVALINVNHDMDVMKEESFGPILGIQKVSGDEQALQLMNDTRYGLTAGVVCEDEKRATEILSQLEVGNGYVNCCDRVSPYLPWAGQRDSGLGATLGHAGILAFVRPQGIHVRKL